MNEPLNFKINREYAEQFLDLLGFKKVENIENLEEELNWSESCSYEDD